MAIERSDLHEVLADINREIDHQTDKWGEQYHDLNTWMMITLEEFGELCAAINESNYAAAYDEAIDTMACILHTVDEIIRQRDQRVPVDYTRQNMSVLS